MEVWMFMIWEYDPSTRVFRWCFYIVRSKLHAWWNLKKRSFTWALLSPAGRFMNSNKNASNAMTFYCVILSTADAQIEAYKLQSQFVNTRRLKAYLLTTTFCPKCISIKVVELDFGLTPHLTLKSSRTVLGAICSDRWNGHGVFPKGSLGTRK